MLPASVKTVTAPSTAPPSPASGFQPLRIVKPSQTPAPSERYTWRVQIASPMASTGGSRLVQDGSISGGMGRSGGAARWYHRARTAGRGPLRRRPPLASAVLRDDARLRR